MMNIRHFLTLALVALLPSLACAADVGVSSTTLFRFEQRAFPGFGKQTVAPATEYIGADMEKLGDGNLSFHMYGWGRVDLADRSTNEGTTDGDLAYGYLNYRFPKANSDVKAGRFFVREGVAVEQIDGVSARTDLRNGFALAIFSGAPVKLEGDENSKGNFIAGGRGSYRLKGMFELGVSGLHEGRVTLDPASGTKSDRQLVGGDVWLLPHRVIELNGHTFYNTATDGLAEHSYLIFIRPKKSLTVSGIYNEQRFRNYFTYSNIRSLFNPDNNGEEKSYGGAITWIVNAPLELSADYRRYNRFSAISNDNSGNSNRFGGEARVTLLDKKVRTGLSYHRSEGASGFNSYHELRGYGLYDNARYIASLDSIVQFYKDAIFNKNKAFEVIASLGYRILPELALSGEISYGQNPRFNDEVRGVVRLNYNYSYASKGAKK